MRANLRDLSAKAQSEGDGEGIGTHPGTCAIGIMAKSPRPGFSKTRLCPPLTPGQAAQLSGAFLRDTTDNIVDASLIAPIVGYAAYAPTGTESLLRPHLAQQTTCLLADGSIPTPDGIEGFGRCLFHAMAGQLERGHRAACVLSSDSPTLPTAYLIAAATMLLEADDNRVVLGPCNDGGYYLLGARALHAGLFKDIAWSTETVADTTRRRASELGLKVVELPQWYDVDDAEALASLVSEVGGYPAPHTRRVLGELGVNRLLQSSPAA